MCFRDDLCDVKKELSLVKSSLNAERKRNAEHEKEISRRKAQMRESNEIIMKLRDQLATSISKRDSMSTQYEQQAKMLMNKCADDETTIATLETKLAMVSVGRVVDNMMQLLCFGYLIIIRNFNFIWYNLHNL